jgi:hypothetical protein
VGNKGMPLISRTRPKFTEQGWQGWTVMDADDQTGQGGLGLHPLLSYSFLSSLSSFLLKLMKLVVFSSCFARSALDIKNHARTPLPLHIRVMERLYQNGHGLVAIHSNWPCRTCN